MSVRAAHSGAALRVYTFAEARGPRRLSGRWRELGAWRWGGRDNWGHCQVERSKTVLFPDCICPPRLSAGRRHRLPLDERSAAKQAVVS